MGDDTAPSAAAPETPVMLHLYDLTKGMARALSPMLLGKTIEGIWHSGLVVHGKEYFYGYGVSTCAAARTPFGAPDLAVAVGATRAAPSDVRALLEDLRPRYRPEDYNLLAHNCNHFTSELALLLTGEDIPAFVRDQADEVMATPLGRQFAPLILQLEGITSQAHAAGFGAAPAAAAAGAAEAAATAAAAPAEAAPIEAPAAAAAEVAPAAEAAEAMSARAAAGAAAAARAAAAAAGTPAAAPGQSEGRGAEGGGRGAPKPGGA